MHKIYRQLIFILISLVSIMVACNKCQQRKAKQGWNPALEKQMYDVFYVQASNFSDDETAKKEYSDCCLSKMKELFPNGISNMESQMNDNVKVSIMKMGAECSKTFKNHINIWQPEVVKQLKLQFYSFEETKLLPVGVKKEYVDCISFKIVAKFPNGLNDSDKKPLKQFIQESRKECLKLVLNKYQKLKQNKTKITN